jgi:hypothetical protein
MQRHQATRAPSRLARQPLALLTLLLAVTAPPRRADGQGLIRVQQGAELGAFGPYTTLRTEWAAQDLANSRRALAELRSGRTAPATVSLGAAGGPGGYDFPAWAQAAAAARYDGRDPNDTGGFRPYFAPLQQRPCATCVAFAASAAAARWVPPRGPLDGS